MGIWAAVKYALNSTVGTSAFQPLDKLLFTPHGTQTFTSDGTFTVPDGVTKILVTACGGGASCNGSTDRYNAGGQGGACICKKAFSVTPGSKIPITVGKGGVYVHLLGGSAGTPTVIGNLITLPGGAKGNGKYIALSSSTRVDGGGIGGKGIDSSNEAIECIGEDGLVGKGGNPLLYDGKEYGGGGGSLGNGAIPQNVSFAFNGIKAGYGGGGAFSNYNNTVKNGGDGIVIIEW